MAQAKAISAERKRRRLRIRHVLIAGAIALVCLLARFVQPADELLWVLQSRIAPAESSGQIVFVGAEEDLSAPDFPERRRKLAQLIERLDEAGVSRIYVDFVFDRPTAGRADAELNAALRNFSGEVHLVDRVRTGISGADEWRRSIHGVSRGVPAVGSELYRNFLGYIWNTPYEVSDGVRTLPNIAADIAGVEPTDSETLPISYQTAFNTIPIISMQEAVANDARLRSLSGKTVVIASAKGSGGYSFAIPGLTGISSGLVHIYAAETLLADRTHIISAPFVFAAFFVLLFLAVLLRSKGTRRAVYVALGAGLPVLLIVASFLQTYIALADTAIMLLIFAIARFRASIADSVRLVDAETNLPTFAALEQDREVADAVPALIVARIHRFEEVRRSLPGELHGEYVLRITNRLKAATQDAEIYTGQGHMLAWTMAEKDPALLREHLEGLRALFSAPLIVGDQHVDVGISFGVDITPSPNVVQRLASAVATAEQTNETYDPILFADTASDEDLIWNISLQARIDTALSNGEIYLNYQPKVSVATGEIVGAEVLVRWRDPVRGNIPPDNFIRQCETAGRMTQLTRHVLEKACRAGNAFEERGFVLPIAVNISATLVHDPAIVAMVSQVLGETGFDPRRLTLEITETYRISNIDQAADILRQLANLGIKISMDDFGVGAASLEALMRLPFNELKIDRVFVAAVASDAKAEGIVRNVLQMGKDMRIIVVAEGVEDEGTLRILRGMGCLVAQGFGISRPVDFDEIVSLQKVAPQTWLKNMV